MLNVENRKEGLTLLTRLWSYLFSWFQWQVLFGRNNNGAEVCCPRCVCIDKPLCIYTIQQERTVSFLANVCAILRYQSCNYEEHVDTFRATCAFHALRMTSVCQTLCFRFPGQSSAWCSFFRWSLSEKSSVQLSPASFKSHQQSFLLLLLLTF